MRTAATLLKNWLLHVRSLPRGIVFIFDLACSALALWIAFLLRFNFDLELIGKYAIYEFLGITLIINVFCFYIFKTYSGIIRQTSMQDIRKVLSATLLCTIVLFGWNLVAQISNWDVVLPASVALIYLFTASIILFGYRLFVKAAFEFLSGDGLRLTNVIILGANEAGQITLEALHRAQHQRGRREKMNVVAILDTDSRLWKKQLQVGS